MGKRRAARLGRTGAFCGLIAAAWALAQGPAGTDAASPTVESVGNREPVVMANAPDGGLAVRAGERAVLVVEALDADVVADGAAEPVWLSAAFLRGAGKVLPEWLKETAWSSGPTPEARLEIGLSPPVDAAPGSYTVVAGATDARGLSTIRTYAVTVLGPRCGGALEILDDGVCRTCTEHELPDAPGTACVPCPSGTERPAGTLSCTDCAPGLVSEAGEACGCGPVLRLDGGVCVECPPDTESAADGEACVDCPLGTERPAGAAACTDCAPEAVCAAAPVKAGAPGGVGAKRAAADTVAPVITSAAYAGDTVTMAMSEPVWAETAPAVGDFALTVTENGASVTATVAAVTVASQAAEADDGIALTLSAALGGSATVSLTYTANAVAEQRPRDAAGNRLGTQTVSVAPLRTLAVSFGSLTDDEVAEDAGRVRGTLTLENPPDTGKYTGCGLRLASDSTAAAADVEFLSADKELKSGNSWSAANARLLRVVDDALAEGDEALIVEAYCTGGDAGMVPAASGLVSAPTTVNLTDDESRTITLSVEPASVAETAAATPVTVTATLDGEATGELALPLTLAGTATADDYTATGTRSITIAAGSRTGTTQLTVTPSADDDDADETVTLASTLTGYAVTGATLTLAEPVPAPTVVASVDSATISEDAGQVNVRLTLENPPATGNYTGCRLRLGTGGVAETPADATFANQKKLNQNNGWTARAKFLTVVDDTLVEGDETLVVEGHCTGSKSGTEPSHTELASQPLTLTVTDNDTPEPLTLSVRPDTVGETLGEQTVTVTTAVDSAPSSDVTVSLTLGTGSYAVTGSQSVVIAAGLTEGTTELVFTPSDDSNTDDDSVTIDGTAAGYMVTGTSLTIEEPTTVGPVDVSGLGIALSVSPTAIRESTSGTYTLTATLTGVPVPTVNVAFVLAVGGTATNGATHDYTLTGDADWKSLTVAANDAHLTASTSVTVAAGTDSTEEGEETVTFTVSQVTWGTTVVTLPTPATATLRLTEAWSKPSAPAGLEAAPAAGDERHGLDVSWEAVTAVPPVDGYVVRHQEVGTSMWNPLAQQPGLTTTVTGLKAGTRYEVRVLAKNAAGDGPESGGVFVYTADGACTVGAPRVTTPSGTRSATELEVAWDEAACAPNVTVASYRVRYREDPAIESVTNDWSPDTASGRTATLTSLTPDTAYVVEVRAVETGGDKGSWSTAGTGRTALDSRLPPRVGAPAVAGHADYGDERLDATWTRVTWTDDEDVAQPITEYQYRIREDGGNWTEATDAQANAAETASMTRTISGLDSGTWHEVQVRGVNRMMGTAYPGKWSEPGRGRTWGVPDRVEEPAAYLTGTAVVVIWDAPNDGGSRITDYDVQYKTSESGGWTPHTYAGCGVGSCETMTSIPALAKKVQVRAENAVGPSEEWSPTANVRQLKLLRVSYSQASATVDEGTSLLVTARLDGDTDRPVSVPVTTTGGAGAFRLDNAANNTIAFGLGTREQTFTLAALQDIDNDDETVTLGFGNLPDGVLLAAPASLVVTIDDDEPNGTPTFNEGDTATRTVAENTDAPGAVGAPVTATDPDSDTLTYSLAGTDAALFDIDTTTGQIKVGSGTALNFEGETTSYALTVQVSDRKDRAGAAETPPAVDATIAVTVNVSDETEPPSAPDAPTLAPGTTTLKVTWTERDTTGPRITDYDVFYRESGETDWEDAGFEGPGAMTTLTELEVGTAHEVYIEATNDEGTSDPSATAEANTLPRVTLTASATKPAIGADNAEATVTLTATAEAAGGGTLTGAWLEGSGGTPKVLQDNLVLTSGTAVTREVASATPETRTFAFRVRHDLNMRTSTTTEDIGIMWRPSVILSVAPAEVREADGAQTVTVTATLTGTALTDTAKTVTVSVGSGTATAGTDFTAVNDITITIPGDTRSATGTFTLPPVADTAEEGPETVLVTGTATDGESLTVVGATLTIDDRAAQLTVTAPTHGYVTGTTGTGLSLTTVIDCGSGNRTDCTEAVTDGSAVTLTATADDSYGFSGWTGDCSGTGTCTLTVDADKTVGATFVELPGAPDAPTATPVDHQSLTVTWTAPTDTGTGVVGYAVRRSVANADDWTETATGSTATTATVAGLAAGTEYDIQVRALATEGGGAWSDSSEAVTLPQVTVTVDDAYPAIPDGNASVFATVTVRATAAQGTLTGRWVRRIGETLRTVNGTEFDTPGGAMTSGRDYEASFRFDAPGIRSYGVMITHSLNTAHGEVGKVTAIEWVPKVVLSASPTSVIEDGGAETVTVTATLTGTSVQDVAKTVTVQVTGGTATVTDDFAAVEDVTITIPAGTRSATGTFDLIPLADTDDENAETVAVGGTAVQGETALPVDGTTVSIANVVRHRLAVTAPTNGRTTGNGIDCGGTQWTDCEATFANNASVTLTASAESGYALDTWTGDCSGRGNCELTMHADKAVGATFGTARTLTVTAPTSGKVTGTVGTEKVVDCGTDCTETVADGTTVALTAAPASGYGFSSWGGDCDTEASADCSVGMDANKTVSASFVVTAVGGECDETAVDGCTAGTLNTTAYADTDTHHQWRCDGTGGGVDSRKCTKAKAACTAGSQDWTVGSNNCSASVTAANSGQTATATDSGTSPNGSATFKCDDGTWIEQAGSTCAPCTPVNGGWATTYGELSACSATACGQSGTRSQSWSRTCTNPSPSCGGAPCSGATGGTRTVSCTGAAPRDGGPSPKSYDPWSSCSASACGASGTQTRSWTSTCTDPPPGCGGADCPGPLSGTETRSCTGSAPRDGGPSPKSYGPWSSCSASACGASGTQTRDWTSTCTDPPPGCGGADCPGPLSGTETRSCTGSAPRDGGPSPKSYDPWSSCSASACGASGIQTRSWTSTCTDPPAGMRRCRLSRPPQRHGDAVVYGLCSARRRPVAKVIWSLEQLFGERVRCVGHSDPQLDEHVHGSPAGMRRCRLSRPPQRHGDAVVYGLCSARRRPRRQSHMVPGAVVRRARAVRRALRPAIGRARARIPRRDAAVQTVPAPSAARRRGRVRALLRETAARRQSHMIPGAVVRRARAACRALRPAIGRARARIPRRDAAVQTVPAPSAARRRGRVRALLRETAARRQSHMIPGAVVRRARAACRALRPAIGRARARIPRRDAAVQTVPPPLSGTETRSCTGSAPRDGAPSPKSYDPWSSCSASACGASGTQTRDWTSTCTDPPPGCGGADCPPPPQRHGDAVVCGLCSARRRLVWEDLWFVECMFGKHV